MMKKLTKDRQFFSEEVSSKLKIILVILVNVVLFAFVIRKWGSYFATNDDYRMRLIIKGNYTGDTEFYSVFINPVLSFCLSLLYKYFGNVPWYGAFELFCLFVCASFFYYYLIRNTKNFKLTLQNSFLYLLVFIFVFLRNIRSVQFTEVAGMLGAVSCLYTLSIIKNIKEGKGNKKNNIIVFGLLLLSMLIRRKTIFLILPLIVYGLICSGIFDLKNMKKYIIYVVTLVLFSAVVYLSDNAFTILTNQVEFREFTDARSKVYDYYQIPSYSKHKKFYNSIGIKRSEYSALVSRTVDVTDQLKTEQYLEVYELAKKEFHKKGFIKRMMIASESMYFQLFGNRLFPEVILLCVLLGLCLLKQRDKKLIIIVLSLIAYITMMTFILAILGRVIYRVIEVMILCSIAVAIYCVNECFFDKFIIHRLKSDSRLERLIYDLIVSVTCLFLLGTCTLYNNNIIAGRFTYKRKSEQLRLLTKYAQDHKDNFYFYSAKDFIAATSSVLKEEEGLLNIDSLGNWNAKSNTYDKRNERFGITTAGEALALNDNVYYAEISIKNNGVSRLMKKNYNKVAKQVDVIQCKNNVEIKIYQFVDYKSEEEENDSI